ncbi:Protein of unknown function [Bacillus wiedmannii]|nr:Protein of unknown function [Bacillus wiedmannii]
MYRFTAGEPTANKIMELFQELEHQEGKCVIVVTYWQELKKIRSSSLFK